MFESVLDWLRGGYPEGVPGPDRVPLLALLRDTPLSDEEIRRVIRAITAPGSRALADGEIGTDEIEAFIAAVRWVWPKQDRIEARLDRIEARLADLESRGISVDLADDDGPDWMGGLLDRSALITDHNGGVR